jgi:nitrogen fixation protein FixH
MKLFLAGLYGLFFFAMACGVTIAYRSAEGLVENNYYEKGNGWFQTKAAERQLGFEVGRPERLVQGSNDLRLTLSSHGRPIDGASVNIFVGNVSSKQYDLAHPMRETAPGVYQTSAVIPARGKWLVRMDLASKQLNTSKSWFYDVN